MKNTPGPRSRCEDAQRELNEIIGRTQSPAEFEQSVRERLQRMASRTKAEKPKRSIPANRSLFNRL